MSSLADGQLPTSPGALYSPTTDGVICTVLLANTSASLTETVTLTLTRLGSTARRIRYTTLGPNETDKVTGIPLSQGDVLSGSTTDASTVDFTVLRGSGDFEAASLDVNGALKQSNSGVSGNQTIGGTLAVTGATTLTGVVTVTGGENLAIGGSTAAAGSTTSDAGVLPAGTAPVYPTTAADGTKGVRISTSDKVTSRTLFIGNGVANQILKVYGPSGATINGGSADAAFSSVSGKGVIAVCLSGSGNTWLMW